MKARRCCLCATDAPGPRDHFTVAEWGGVCHRDCAEAWAAVRWRRLAQDLGGRLERILKRMRLGLI